MESFDFRAALQRGLVIPAHPLALNAARQLDEHRQRALSRYYLAAGAGGLAVGVHTTQFAIRDPKVDLYQPVLALAAEEMQRANRPVVRIAGLCGLTPQAIREAEVARTLGYHAGLLSLAALPQAPVDELAAHCRAVANVLPVIGFYLQPATGGRLLPYAFWRKFAEIENVVAIKIAAFNRYQTLDVVRAVAQRHLRELHAEADRANLFIKIPGTPAGLVAVEEAVFHGVPVNVTLLFSTQQYLAAAEAHLRGLERRREAGLGLKVASVASLFISRWDVALNDVLPADMRNTVGIAVGAATYAAAVALRSSDRVTDWVAAGAPAQKLLFASTGVKDAAAPDTLYVRELAARDTINTMPDATLLAMADHGEAPSALAMDGQSAAAVLAAASAVGVDLDALAEKLQRDGAAAFVSAWEAMISSIATKASA